MNIILLVLTLLFLPCVANGETITLKSGKVLDGEIVGKTDTYVEITDNGKTVKVPMNMMDKGTATRIQDLPNLMQEVKAPTESIPAKDNIPNGDSSQKIVPGLDGREWVVNFFEQNEKESLAEITLKSETADNWKELVIVQDFVGLQDKMNLDQVLRLRLSQVASLCPSIQEAQILVEKNETDLLYQWHDENCASKIGQVELGRIVFEPDRVHLMRYASKVPIEEAKRQQWMDILRKAVFSEAKAAEIRRQNDLSLSQQSNLQSISSETKYNVMSSIEAQIINFFENVVNSSASSLESFLESHSNERTAWNLFKWIFGSLSFVFLLYSLPGFMQNRQLIKRLNQLAKNQCGAVIKSNFFDTFSFIPFVKFIHNGFEVRFGFHKRSGLGEGAEYSPEGTCLVTEFPERVNFQLQLRPRSWTIKLVQLMGMDKELETNFPEFDNEFAVSTDNEFWARKFFSSSIVNNILSIKDLSPCVQITLSHEYAKEDPKVLFARLNKKITFKEIGQTMYKIFTNDVKEFTRTPLKTSSLIEISSNRILKSQHDCNRLINVGLNFLDELKRLN